jgi:hypothetical protein
MSDPNMTEIQVENRKQLSPLLEWVYAVAQRAAKQAEEAVGKDKANDKAR